ncbi:related to VPS52 - component of the Golgi-associated retrograde protein complex [Ustilago trichophora]|uniref:Related to VPS52 - component of the Golgi-associated retrograde protein complex n=1 Tax=Ustilago trichophora TaxID=86804 RepID=A0A5C3E0U1_9BASI|nr:related to VPS52 - component of the Golgi-associated retrograde protein complex [Ustilago trichophora]
MTVVDDTDAERLSSIATSASQLTSSSSSTIQQLYTSALARRSTLEQQQDAQYLSLAPTFLSLHQQASTSTQLLDSLETFLSTFQSDLSNLSTHISALQTTSHQIDSRLDATRDVEIQLASFLSEIALSPRVVDLFFETEPESRPELWLKAVKQLERVLEATSPSASLPIPTLAAGASSEELGDIQAVQEVRSVAEACKNVVASKLRTYLTSPHASIKASVTTNLQVLQTSVLLRHHKPLYAFLARQMPRVAIDVQRSYVAATRLYFETAFRRYGRSLGVVRKRWAESSGSALITDPIPSGSGSGSSYAAGAITGLQNGMVSLSKLMSTSSTSTGTGGAFFRAGGSSTPRSNPDNNNNNALSTGDADFMSIPDPWLFPTSRLQYSKLDSPSSSTVLGYLADEASFKACPENLFRSLSLVLIDNACSEFCFLVRFFEGVSSSLENDEEASSATSKKDQKKEAGQGVASEESASAAGDETVEEDNTSSSNNNPVASVVQLSLFEQSKIKGRGASEEIFKQIFEPALSTWTNFTRSLLHPNASSASTLAASATSVVSGSGVAAGSGGGSIGGPAGYFSLLSMVQLNDALLSLISSRGCTNGVVESALMGFKIAAYPLLKRFLDDQIGAISTFTNGGITSNASSSSGSSSMWGMINSLTGTSSTSSTSLSSLDSDLVEVICIRYTSLFTKTLYILGDIPDPGLITALIRLRTELAKLFTTTISKTTTTTTTMWNKDSKTKTIRSLITTLEATTSIAGTGLSSHTQVQNEFSFWNEQLKLIS